MQKRKMVVNIFNDFTTNISLYKVNEVLIIHFSCLLFNINCIILNMYENYEIKDLHHHHIQSPPSSWFSINLILIKKWGQHLREYEYLKVKRCVQKWIRREELKLTNIYLYDNSYTSSLLNNLKHGKEIVFLKKFAIYLKYDKDILILMRKDVNPID